MIMKYLSACFVLLIVGCGVRPPIEGRGDPYVRHQINPVDEEVARHTALGTPILTRDPETQILYVQVPIRNTTDRQVIIDYRVKFFGRGGQVMYEMAWKDKVLAPNVPDYIVFNSASAE